ncbi:flagellar filament capping protein FliD [Massilia sp. NR 4-1]|uniref:flagellar filament capping protein FliD n=1 Tax=Massilia sp. NR 4-1 TaxID=1678028 RepID=UPI00067DAC98|nr:flagellar filament capping protein FliD [Massilia sp. NR 4-1]AKU24276.1 flagellar hook protein 2 [Massilia sp. NR 4-1]
MASTSGVTSGGSIDVNAIVEKLMTVETRPLAAFEKKTASFQAKLSAFGTLSGAVAKFQSSLGSLSSVANFKSLTAKAGDESVLTATATGKASAGNYNINVSQLAQAQSLVSKGQASTTSAIGVGAKTTLFFQFGTTTGNFGLNGSTLSHAVLSGGISNGSLMLNGTAIATDSTTNSARTLAEAINAKSTTTGVTATAGATSTAANLFSTFGDVATGGDGAYTLSVAGVQIAAQGANVAAGAGVTAASVDAALAGPGAVATALAAANITVSGTAAGGDLKFTRSDGSNITLTETVSGSAAAVTGGIGNAAGAVNGGFSVTAGSSISLTSTNGSQIRVGGTNAAAAGLVEGTAGSYLGGSFSQDATQASGSVLIDSSNNSLQGIRDAINKAGIGVTASIISDGSTAGNRLVLTSNKTGVASSMKISLNGDGTDPPDAALSTLLGYDPGGTQNMVQSAAAQDTKLTVNGIAVNSPNTSVSDAIQGVTLSVTKVGSSSLSISKDGSSLKTSIDGFVKAYNELNKSVKELTAYDPETKKAGPLVGDATVQSVQSQVRRVLASSITGLTGDLSTLNQIGLSIDHKGVMSLDGGKLQKAIDQNFNSIAGLFAAIGAASDTQVNFLSSTAATKPGTYDLTVTALASQGSLTSSDPLAATTTIAPNTRWSVVLNDTKPSNSKNISEVTIPPGTYTPAEMAKVLQAAINGVPAFSSAGSTVAASIDANGKLVLSSSRYGSDSNIGVADVTGTGVASLFGAAAPVVGVDVAGTLGGQAVVGKGQTMTGAPGGPTEGLKIEITGGAVGNRGTVSFSQGYAYQLNNLATAILDSKGLIGGKTEGLNNSVKDVAKQREKFTDRLEGIEKRYRDLYSRLDVSLTKMQNTQNYLSQQLAQLSANR